MNFADFEASLSKGISFIWKNKSFEQIQIREDPFLVLLFWRFLLKIYIYIYAFIHRTVLAWSWIKVAYFSHSATKLIYHIEFSWIENNKTKITIFPFAYLCSHIFLGNLIDWNARKVIKGDGLKMGNELNESFNVRP